MDCAREYKPQGKVAQCCHLEQPTSVLSNYKTIYWQLLRASSALLPGVKLLTTTRVYSLRL